MTAQIRFLDASEARRRALFRTYEDLRRQVRDGTDFELHRLAAEAYRAFLRSFLDVDERAVLDLHDEVAELRAEVARLRSGNERSAS